jgi:hypothetical protein
MKTEGRELSVDENWPTGNEMIINTYMSVDPIPLYDVTTIISVASKTLKKHIFENVLFSTRRPHGWRIMNLFRKLKLCCASSNSFSLPITHPWNKARVKPPSVQTSPAHKSYAQQFLSVNVSNRAAQCQISWPATARKQQRDSPCLVLVPLEHKTSKSECR